MKLVLSGKWLTSASIRSTLTMSATKPIKRKHDSSSEQSGATKKPTFHWNKGLLASMDDPELQVDADDKIVVIKDKYPKAKYHFLIMPKQSIPNLKSLCPENLELLQHMHAKGKEVARSHDKTTQFRYGYHAVPSMSHLHLHVISQDFDSPCLKTKKHWNSFTTEYFVDSKEIMRKLKENGKVDLDSSGFQDMLKRDLRCHVCSKGFSTMPALKTHIKTHSYSIS